MINRVQLENKWQDIWQKEEIFKGTENNQRKKYILEMFPYPSGKIHVGHLRNYTIGDVIARFYIANGFDVLHSMGWDSFGLPAENAAITHKTHPKKWTYENIKSMKLQLKKMGLSYDWDKELITCDPEYYKLEQEFFIDLFNKKLAYKKLSPVNWDPVDQTVLSNEQVVDNKGWRSGAPIEKKYLSQWFLKITDYAEELLTSLDKMDGWPEKIKTMQRNWIGKSQGDVIKFKVKDSRINEILVFSTRVETIFGASFIAVSHEHEITKILDKDIENKLQDFKKKLFHSEEIKIYLYTKLEAVHPISGISLPIIIASYVLPDYATGAIFGCPGHDIRDYQLAKELALPVIQVITNDTHNSNIGSKSYEEKNGTIINSSFLNGLDIQSAKNKIKEHLISLNVLEQRNIYKLRDWCISRQRYWGAPIPIIYCPKCGTIGANKKDLPIKLPEDIAITHSGTILNDHPSWKYVHCHICGSKATRETDTFDTFFESSWYYFKYCTAKKDYIIRQEEVKKWLPVDQYIGGIEHAVIHLLYSRFFTKLLSDLKHIEIREPFLSVIPQGMVLHKTYKDIDGNWVYPNDVIEDNNKNLIHKITKKPVTEGKEEKMSKSKYNVIDLQDGLEQFGADVLRLFVLSDTPIEKELVWSDYNINSIEKFLNKLMSFTKSISQKKFSDMKNYLLEQEMHLTIKKVTADIESMHLNIAIANIRKFFNKVKEYITTHTETLTSISVKNSILAILRLFHPFIPHVTEEMWSYFYPNKLLAKEKWPIYDSLKIKQDSYVLAIQINGKLRIKEKFQTRLNNQEVQNAVLSLPLIQKYLEGQKIKKIIFIEKKIINILI